MKRLELSEKVIKDMKKILPELNVEQSNQIGNQIYRMEPFHYTYKMSFDEIRNLMSNDNTLYGSTQEFAMGFYRDLNSIITSDEVSMVRIDENIMNTILDTDNEVFYRPLFNDFLFIDFEYEVEENMVIKGLTIMDANSKNISNNSESLVVFLLMFDKRDFSNNFMKFRIGKDSDISDENFSKKELKTVNKLRNIVCNIIDLVEDEQLVETITIVKDVKQNEKRLKKGKIPMPTKVVIKPKKDFKIYLDEYKTNSEKFKYSHRFKVRGHWRHYRSDRYSIEKRNTKKWVKPFFKGSGITIKKEYEIKGD